MKLVLLESPLSASTPKGLQENFIYARQALLDSIHRGEAPLASHLLYTQVLNDEIPAHREHGMELGWEWLRAVEQVVVYCDRGITSGMDAGITRAQDRNLPIIYRQILGTYHASDTRPR